MAKEQFPQKPLHELPAMLSSLLMSGCFNNNTFVYVTKYMLLNMSGCKTL